MSDAKNPFAHFKEDFRTAFFPEAAESWAQNGNDGGVIGQDTHAAKV